MQTTTLRYSRQRKGQSAFEFMFIFGLMLAAVALSLYISGIKTGEIRQETRKLEIDDFMMSLTEKINTAWIEGEGFSSNITLPGRIAGSDYDINISHSYVTLYVGEEHFLRQTIASNITGTPVKGGTSTIRNTGDGLLIS